RCLEMKRRRERGTQGRWGAASEGYKRQGYYLRGINNSGENYGLAQILSGLMERRQPPDIKSKAT
ncbi:hypothetical protein CRN01_10550, partial [Enterococcus faecium]